MTGAGQAQFDGLRFVGADTHFDIADLPLTLEGVPFGDARGQVTVVAKRTEHDLAITVGIPTMHVELPGGSARAVQGLDPSPDIEIVSDRHRAAEPVVVEASKLTLVFNIGKIEIKGSSVDVDVAGVQGAPLRIELADKTRISGDIKLTHGRIEVLHKPFDIEQGLVHMRPEDPGNPYINVTARWDSPDGPIFIEYAGVLFPITPEKIKYRSPSIPEDRIMATLLFGGVEQSTLGATNSSTAGGVPGQSLATQLIAAQFSAQIATNISTSIGANDDGTLRPGLVYNSGNKVIELSTYGAFVRCYCDACHHDVLVPFSCKQRGLCPSCGTRRMCDEAANITDRILPNAPVRQWVMSLPRELCGLAATKPDVLTALGRIFAEEVARATKRLAGVAGAETGAVSFPQRFGSSLNLHVHFHLLAVDAVFEKHGAGVRVHEAPPPGKTDVADVVQRVHDRALVWLRRHRYLDGRAAEERGNEPPADTPVDGLARLALGGGTFLGRPFTPKDRVDEKLDRKEPRFAATYNGFDVHCAVRLAADDDEGRERLIRYCARPPFALERIEEMKDGRISYLLKTPRRGSTHRVMTPVEFMGRLAILVPPPFFPLVRYHGVFAARSSWRALVTPKPPDGVARRKKPKACTDATTANAPTTAAPAEPAALPARTTPEPTVQPHANDAANAPASALPLGLPAAPAPTATPISAPSDAHASPLALDDPTTITVKHWNRILDGELFATSSRVEWAVLMQRTFGFDAMRCPKCDAKMRVLATINDPLVVKKILSHLGVRTEPLPRARARDPTGQMDLSFDAA